MAIKQRIKAADKSQNDGADAALSPATVKTAITALEGSTPQTTPKAITTARTQRWSRISQVTPNTARSRRPITVIPRDELIKLPRDRSTVRTTMHSSSRKHIWNKITSTEAYGHCEKSKEAEAKA